MWLRHSFAVFALAAVSIVWATEKQPGPANRLAKESSPYLRQHAHNPVDWYPWGPEAFEKAKKENKLVFLSIGYSSCHWCHVMERESFNNKEVAKILNDHFVCIKVDREERPDVDQIYMTALNAAFGQRGGWPLSMFLTPDGKPVIGGTYWPPEDRVIEGEKLHGFKSILRIMIDVRKTQEKQVFEQADKVAKITADALSQLPLGQALIELNRKLIDEALEQIADEFDPVHGGFGRKTRNFAGTKFPVPSYLEFLITERRRNRTDDVPKMLDLTLERMARGGIYDQLGGGFHRYSTERTWTVPHFEKMLYDNAQLVEVYSKAFALDPKPLYERIVRETLAYIAREMTSPQGGFYSALDADSEGEEGRFYVWTPKELEQSLPVRVELDLAREVYGIDKGLNFENKYSILTYPESLREIAAKRQITEAELKRQLDAVRKKLHDVRAKRERPFLDTKVLTAWNGQMIAGYAVAGKVFRDSDYVKTAIKAADFVLTTMRTKEGRLLRTWMPDTGAKLNGYLDDYAFLAHGLLALHDVTGDERWLTEAKAVIDAMIQWHLDDKAGGFFYTSHDHEKLFARAKDQHDGAQPSGNSMAARVLVALAAKTRDKSYSELAEKTIKTFAPFLKTNATYMTLLAAALNDLLATRTPVQNLGGLPKPGDARRSDSVVKVVAKADKPDAANKQTIVVTLTVEKDWHIYANPVDNDMQQPAQTEIKISGKGMPKTIQIVYPKGKNVEDKTVGDYRIYEGTVEIKIQIERAAGDREPVEIAVKILACNSKTKVCLLPASVKTTVP